MGSQFYFGNHNKEDLLVIYSTKLALEFSHHKCFLFLERCSLFVLLLELFLSDNYVNDRLFDSSIHHNHSNYRQLFYSFLIGYLLLLLLDQQILGHIDVCYHIL